jgi:hypothetical protein
MYLNSKFYSICNLYILEVSVRRAITPQLLTKNIKFNKTPSVRYICFFLDTSWGVMIHLVLSL